MLFRYLSPWDFGEHSQSIALRAFKVSCAMSIFKIMHRVFIHAAYGYEKITANELSQFCFAIWFNE